MLIQLASVIKSYLV